MLNSFVQVHSRLTYTTLTYDEDKLHLSWVHYWSCISVFVSIIPQETHFSCPSSPSSLRFVFAHFAYSTSFCTSINPRPPFNMWVIPSECMYWVWACLLNYPSSLFSTLRLHRLHFRAKERWKGEYIFVATSKRRDLDKSRLGWLSVSFLSHVWWLSWLLRYSRPRRVGYLVWTRGFGDCRQF